MSQFFTIKPLTAAEFEAPEANDGQVLTADGAGKAIWEDSTGGGAGVTDVTYAELVAAIGADALTPGGWYRITDYATTHYIVDGDGTIYTSPVAQVDTVTLSGTSGTATIDVVGGLSKLATFDGDLETTAANFVTDWAAAYLANPIRVVVTSSGPDIIFTAEVPGTAFDRPTIANVSGDLGLAVAQVDTLTLSGTDGSAEITIDSVVRSITFTDDLATTAEDFFTAHATAYAVLGIILANSDADLIFTAVAPGTPFTSPTITNLDGSLDGTVDPTETNQVAAISMHTTANDNPVIVGETEPLLVLATATDQIDGQVYSVLHPEDQIRYDWNPDNWLYDLSFCEDQATIIAGWKGVIVFRWDTTFDNYAGYDWRNVLFRRWQTDAEPWDADAGYSAGSIVNYGGVTGGVYQAMFDIPASEAQIHTVTLTGTVGSATIDTAGGLSKLLTFADDLETTAGDFVTTWQDDYLLQGIVVTASSADLIFTALIPGTAFDAPTVNNLTGDLCLAVAQVETLTLTGTDGTADISAAGGLTRTATFASDLGTTAGNFVTANAAAYLVEHIVLTSSGADLIFTAEVPGTAFVPPVIENATLSLDGTVDPTTPNNPAPTIAPAHANVPPNSDPATDTANWIKLLALSSIQNWNAEPSSWLGVPSATQEFADYITFKYDDPFKNYIRGNHLEPMRDDANYWNDIATILSNNVLLGANTYANVLGAGANSNVLGVGAYFNVLGAGATSNMLGAGAKSNVLGANTYANVLGVGAQYNVLGAGAQYNVLGAGAQYNVLGANTYANVLGVGAQYNVLGAGAQYNVLGANTYANVLGANTYANVLGVGAQYNVLGAGAQYNVLGAGAYFNVLDVAAYANVLGASAQFNVLGVGATSNMLGAYATSNMLGAGANFNVLGANANYNVLGANTYANMLGAGANFNVLGANANYNVLGAGAQYNDFAPGVMDLDCTLGTHVYAAYQCWIAVDNTLGARLRYYDNDTVVFADPTA